MNQGQDGYTLAEMEADEKALVQRRDAYVQEANMNISAMNGAIQQVQAQKARLLEKQQKGQEVEKKGRRRGKVAKKETPVSTEVVTAPQALADVA
jgi:hypothetical protein